MGCGDGYGFRDSSFVPQDKGGLMKICEDCQHKEVCRFKDDAQNNIDFMSIPEPLELKCKYKIFMESVSCPSMWTYDYGGTYTDPNVTFTVCN